jgi:hypothetical protein
MPEGYNCVSEVRSLGPAMAPAIAPQAPAVIKLQFL